MHEIQRQKCTPTTFGIDELSDDQETPRPMCSEEHFESHGFKECGQCYNEFDSALIRRGTFTSPYRYAPRLPST